MLHRRLIVFIYLFILLAGIYAQKYARNGNNDDEEEDDEADPEPEARQQPPPPPPRKVEVLNNNENTQNRIPPGNIGLGRKPIVSPPRSTSTPLASSVECKADVQKYCAKGSQQIISNLKVLQCVDDLDNVSFQNKFSSHLFIISNLGYQSNY
jgi:hypothetical protein